MENVTLQEEKIHVLYGCSNLELTKERLLLVGLLTIDDDNKKAVFHLLEKLRTEGYESIYEDLIYDIKAENEARKAAREQFVAVLMDCSGNEAEALLRA